MEKYALVLGGGGSRGAYEIGVWQALRELEIPIDIVTGTSVGALNGVLIAQHRFHDAVNLWKDLETHMVFDVDDIPLDFQIGGFHAGDTLAYIKEMFTNKGAGTSGLDDIVSKYMDEEKVRSSDVDFGLVTVQIPSMRPLYVFTDQIPQGKLSDYVIASAACFPAITSREIDGNKFIDGGYADVMPVKMALERGADHIIAVYLNGAGRLRKERLEEAEKTAKTFKLIQSSWDLGNILSFNTDNTRRIMRLGYLDTMKSFGVFEGDRFTFRKGIFNAHQLAGAEAAADAFELNPTPVYGTELLIEKLKENLDKNPLVVQIANDLQKKEADSIFTSRRAFRMMKEEIQAANFILRYGIL